jgi:glycosyltransferase involved in cell wall biosynthesis
VNENTGWLLVDSDPRTIKQALENVISLAANQIDRKKEFALELIRTNYTWEHLVPSLIKKIEKTISS